MSNLAPSPWARPNPLFIKPPFRRPLNEEAKKSSNPQSPLFSGLGLGLRWVSLPNNTTLS